MTKNQILFTDKKNIGTLFTFKIQVLKYTRLGALIGTYLKVDSIF